MAFVFISYQSADQKVAERLKCYIDETLHLSSFLSCDPHDGIAVGKKWPTEVCEHLEHAEVVCMIVSPNWINSKYCDDEYRLARYFNKHILTLALDINEDVNNFLKLEVGYENYLSCSRKEIQRAFKSLKSSIESLIKQSSQTPFTFQGLNPYRGLLAYEEEDAAVFFGREDERKKMVDVILHMPYKEHKIYVLYGSSGIGKSSLLKAGILPYLRYGRNKKWAILPLFTASKISLEIFTGVLANYLKKESKVVKNLLEKSLHNHCEIEKIIFEIDEEHKKKYGEYPIHILLAVDQFELLFSETSNNKLFMRLLKNFINHPRVYVITTLRSDFLFEFQATSFFMTSENQNAVKFEVVHPVAKYKIVDIIKAPAKLPELRGKIEIDDLFVEKIKNDIEGQDDMLPLLSLLLSNLYENHNGKLKASTYAQGELAKLINTIAEEAIENWVNDEVTMGLLKNIFMNQLVSISENKKVVKVKASRNSFPPRVEGAIESLVRSRLLLSFSDDTVHSEIKKVEIAHEALIRHWGRLSKWIDDEYEFLIIKKEVGELYLSWKISGQSQDALLVGGVLKRIIDDVKLEKKFANTKLSEYVEKSVAYFKLQQKKRRVFVAGSFFSITGLAIFGNVQYFQAKNSKEVLKNEIRKTKHNIGILFSDRASYYLSQKKITRAKLYANYALKTMDMRQKETQEKINKMVGILHCFNEVKCAYIDDHHKKMKYIKVVGNKNLSIVYVSTIDGNVLVCNAKTGENRELFSDKQKHNGRIYDMKLSVDNNTLVTVSADKQIKITKLDTLEIISSAVVHGDGISSVILLDVEKTFITASYDAQIIFWDLDTLNPKKILSSYHSKPIKAIALSKDRNFLFSASYDKTIGVYNIKEKKLLYKLEGHNGKVNRVIVHPKKNDIIFSSSDDGTVREWYIGMNAGKQNKTLFRSENSIFDIQISSDAKRLYITSDDKTITIWSLERDCKEVVLDSHESYSSSVAISEDNATLVTTSWDETIRYWDIAYFSSHPILWKSHHGRITALANNNQMLYATAGNDNTIKIWNVNKKVVLKTFYGHSNAVYDLVFYNKQKKIISASRDQTIRVWDLEGVSPTQVINSHKGRVYSLAVDKTERYLASASQDKMVYVYDLEEDNKILFSGKHISDVFHVTFINERFLCSTSENIIYVWDIFSKTDKPLYRLANHHEKIYDFVYSEKTKCAYSSSKDGEILQWKLDVTKDTCRKPIIKYKFEGHASNVYAMALSSDGSKLISADKEYNIKIWDTTKAKVLTTLQGHVDRIYHIALLKDDKTLLSVSWDGSIRIWDTSSNTENNPEAIQVIREYPDCEIISTNPLQIKAHNGVMLNQNKIMINIDSLEKELQISLKNTTVEKKKIPYAKPIWSKYHPLFNG